MSHTETDGMPSSLRGRDTGRDTASHPRLLPLLLSLSVIFFLIGSAVTEYRCFPYSELLQPAYTAAHAVHRRFALTSSLADTDLWHTARFHRRGVVHNESAKTCNGYTLYTSGHASAAYLIDMNGQVVHQWQVPFHSLWSKPPHVEHPVPEAFIYWHARTFVSQR